jgi:superfamily II DNA or RNA helicase
VATSAQASGFKADGLHGDLDQHTRMDILSSFKSGRLHVLVATDVAARGLDIRSIRTVVNYDVAKSIDTHVHRIGRTGRAGDKEGQAVTLLLPNETRMAAALAENLRSVGQAVPKCAALSAQCCSVHACMVACLACRTVRPGCTCVSLGHGCGSDLFRLRIRYPHISPRCRGRTSCGGWHDHRPRQGICFLRCKSTAPCVGTCWTSP